jgi:hypothetical protein
MSDSKRRKNLDRNYGKPQLLRLDIINFCNSVIAQESAFVILDYWSDSSIVTIGSVGIENLQPTRQLAYDIARQRPILELGIQRQSEQLGCLSIMDTSFRTLLGLKDFGADDSTVLNWLSEVEIDECHQEFYRQKKGRAAIFEIIKYLMMNCQSTHQFPCWFSGVKLETDKLIDTDIIFICVYRNPSKLQIDTEIRSQKYS